jgi:Tfp pilus assembly protein PilF
VSKSSMLSKNSGWVGARLAVLLLPPFLLAACAGTGQEGAKEPGLSELMQSEVKLTAEEIPETRDLAKQAIAEGRHKDAVALLERLLTVDPNDEQAILVLSELYLNKAQFKRAEQGFDRLLDSSENAALGYQGKGLATLLQGQPERGHEALLAAVERDPNLWRAWSGLGYYHDLRAEWPQSSEMYQRALSINPNAATVYNNLGFSLFIQGETEAAIKNLRRALELDPNLTPARANYRLALARAGRYEQSIAAVSKEDRAAALNNAGYMALLRGDLTLAESYLVQSLEEAPAFNEKAYKNLEYLRGLRSVEEGGAQRSDASSAALTS